jgi:hypothetical protein
MSDEETEKVEEDAIISLSKDVSVSKESLRKLHRESERLLRERRCMIRPAPVQRRSFGDLIQKISARATNLEKSKDFISKPVESCTIKTGGLDGFKPLLIPSDASQMDLQHEFGSPPPNAPGEEGVQANTNPVGLNEEDEEDEELVIITTNQANLLPKINVPRNVEPAPSPFPQHTEKKPSAAPVPRSLTAFSPPANNSRRMRMALLDSFRKTAQLRSEHLPKAVSSLQLKLKSEASPSGDATSMTSDAVKDLPFIPSNKFSGSKQGYVYKFDVQGLGYYPDIPQGMNSSKESNVLPPPIEDLPEDQKFTQKSVDEEEGESQPFGLEAGEELVLEYDEDGEGESMPICGASVGMETDSEPHPPAALKPLRTYAKKDKPSKAEIEDPDSSQIDAVHDSEASDSRCAEASGSRSSESFKSATIKRDKHQLQQTASAETQSGDESTGDADDEEVFDQFLLLCTTLPPHFLLQDNGGEGEGGDGDHSSDEAEETDSEESESSEEDEDEVVTSFLYSPARL